MSNNNKKADERKGTPKIIFTGQTINEWYVGDYTIEKGTTKYKCTCTECGLVRVIRGSNLKNGKTPTCRHKEPTKPIMNPLGMKYGQWEIIDYVGKSVVVVRCSCGETREIHLRYLRDGTSTSCGHDKVGLTSKLIDMTGQTIGQWKVHQYLRDKLWICNCIKCGREKVIYGNVLRNGKQTCICDTQERVAKENMEKYGVRSLKQLNSSRTPEQMEAYSSRENLLAVIKETPAFLGDKPTIKEIALKIGIDSPSVLRFVRKYNLENHVSIGLTKSIYEAELANMYKCEHTSNRQVLNGKEIDLYYPEKAFGIEFNGDYWHCELNKNKDYHQEKTLLAAKKKIQLFHIFEYEWLNPDTKRKIIALIDRKLGKTEVDRIYARDCEVHEISHAQSKEFLDLYHLQNSTNARIRLGLFRGEELLGVMTFDAPRFNKDFQYELIRLAWKSGITVLGGTEKIFKHFERQYKPESIISYVDISKFTGNVYLRLGFQSGRESVTAPNYRWVNVLTGETLTRYQTQKHLLLEKGLGEYGDTEVEIMQNLGFYRVYDAGNLRLTWKKEV